MKKKTRFNAVEIFGDSGAEYLKMLDRILTVLRPAELHFYSLKEHTELGKKDPEQALKVYWEELLFRLYVVGVVSIRRNHQWLDATLNAPNIYGFYSSLRGLLESLTDSYYSLEGAPKLLASLGFKLHQLFNGFQRDRTAFFSEELENKAIHFLFGRRVKKGEADQMPDDHKAKGATNYIKSMDRKHEFGLESLYADLCEVTHPSLYSLADYVTWDENTSVYSTHLTTKHSYRRIIKEHRKALDHLMYFAFNPPLVLLRVLNELPMKTAHTPGIRSISLENIELWKLCEAEMKASIHNN